MLTPETPQAFALLGADRAWNRATGAGVLVAVVDSGIDAGNPHLAGAVVGGIDLVGDGERGDGLSDPNGHGTAVAGQIAARAVDGSGVVGLAPEAELLSVRVFRGDSDDDIEAGYGPSAERLAAGIRYAAEHGAEIINVSLSDHRDSDALRAAVQFAAERGSLVVASAGNRATSSDASTARYPAAYAAALGVTAADSAGVVTGASRSGPQVDLAAPGQSVLTTATGGGDCVFSAESPSTSFATGYASAAAALVAEAHPHEGPEGWSYRLTAAALRDHPDRRDDVRGWGLVQPAAAIELLPDATTRGPDSPFFDTGDSSVVAEAVTVAPDHAPSPLVATREYTVLAGTIGAALLGVLVVLRRGRRPGVAAPTGGGLLERPDEEERRPGR